MKDPTTGNDDLKESGDLVGFSIFLHIVLFPVSVCILYFRILVVIRRAMVGFRDSNPLRFLKVSVPQNIATV